MTVWPVYALAIPPGNRSFPSGARLRHERRTGGGNGRHAIRTAGFAHPEPDAQRAARADPTPIALLPVPLGPLQLRSG